MNDLGLFLVVQGKLAEAQRVLEQGVQVAVRRFGDKRRITYYLLHNLGNTYRLQRKWIDAERTCRRAWEAGREVLGERHGNTRNSLGYLVSALTAQEKLDEARPYVAKLLRHRRRAAE